MLKGDVQAGVVIVPRAVEPAVRPCVLDVPMQPVPVGGASAQLAVRQHVDGEQASRPPGRARDLGAA